MGFISKVEKLYFDMLNAEIDLDEEFEAENDSFEAIRFNMSFKPKQPKKKVIFSNDYTVHALSHHNVNRMVSVEININDDDISSQCDSDDEPEEDLRDTVHNLRHELIAYEHDKIDMWDMLHEFFPKVNTLAELRHELKHMRDTIEDQDDTIMQLREKVGKQHEGYSNKLEQKIERLESILESKDKLIKLLEEEKQRKYIDAQKCFHDNCQVYKREYEYHEWLVNQIENTNNKDYCVEGWLEKQATNAIKKRTKTKDVSLDNMYFDYVKDELEKIYPTFGLHVSLGDSVCDLDDYCDYGFYKDCLEIRLGDWARSKRMHKKAPKKITVMNRHKGCGITHRDVMDEVYKHLKPYKNNRYYYEGLYMSDKGLEINWGS